jgi:2-methylcitrate dehydratase
MSETTGKQAGKAVDSIQARLTDYACALNYDALPPETVHATKVRVIDTLGALIAGFFAEPSVIARNVAAQTPDANGATVLGTRMKTSTEMAAFVNSSTARYIELTDSYHWPGSFGGHPSDVIGSLIAVAEHLNSSGRDLITSIVLAYEVYLRINDIFHNIGFDQTNFCLLGTAIGAGKLMGLTPQQMAHCISMAIVPNNALRVSRMGHLSMWKVTATGQAGRAGIFAAMLARAGMEGPHLPFEGKAGWCDHVALERFSLPVMGGAGEPFKIGYTSIKLRPTNGLALSSTLAAEKIAPLNISEVAEVLVEVNRKAKDFVGTHAHHWHPDTKETADHSAPYLVGATLLDGAITARSFNDEHLRNPQLRALLPKIKVEENAEFTSAYARKPSEHKARVTVMLKNGQRLVGESGGGKDDLSSPKSDQQIIDKYRTLTEDVLGGKRVNLTLERLWALDKLANAAQIADDFVFI